MESQPGSTAPAQAKFFADLDRRAANAVLASAKLEHVGANAQIFAIGQPAAKLFMLKTGQAQYYRVTEPGVEITLCLLTAGDVLGMNALLRPKMAYQANAAAITDCELLVWKKATIRALSAKYPQLAENALRIALGYLQSYVERHLNLISKTAEQRLAITLLDLAHRIGRVRSQGIEIETTNDQISRLADITRFTTSRMLKTFERSGALSKTRGKVVIHTPEALAIG